MKQLQIIMYCSYNLCWIKFTSKYLKNNKTILSPIKEGLIIDKLPLYI